LKRTLSVFLASILLGIGLVGCGGYGGAVKGRPSKLKFRAFVSNPVHPSSSGGGTPALEIIDATKDVLNRSAISLGGAVPDAGLLVESPKKDRTLVFSPSNNGLAIVNNDTESVASAIGLPGPTESMFVWIDNTTAFIAVPSASVPGQPAGAVGSADISSGTIKAILPVPGAHYLVPSPNGNQILIVSDSANAVTVLYPSLINGGNPLTPVSGSFDKPVWAVFTSDGSTAYVLNCGPQCGGIAAAASVSIVNMSANPPAVTNTVPVPGGATIGLLQGSNLFVAGTPPSPQNDCAGVTPATAATSCGRLTAINTTTLTAATPVSMTDGYHNHMQMGANGQLFIGARNCTNISIAGGEVRGCLSIFDTSSGTVVAPPDNGNVTGIESVPNRHVVYVCEGGALRIYDTTTDKLQTTPAQVSVIGQAIDVKVVD
jgi:hypothetical protein